MKIIKRSGEEVDFDVAKIASAITKANDSLKESDKMSDERIRQISLSIYNTCYESGVTKTVEDVQNMVEDKLIEYNMKELAKRYITYRYEHELLRKSNSTDKTILSLLNESNEDIKQENSNKNPTIVSVQRDYMAGEVSKDISRRFLVPKDIMQAHDEGIIHFHDLDYFAQPMTNCCLCNLEDMLQNGTVISGTKIDKPKSFSTACNVATQIIAQVSSSQFGGQSITLSHLAPFVDVSRQKIKSKLREKFNILGITVDNDKFNELVELEVKEEIKRGVQIIQYQVITLMTTNGQAPFITVFMYLNEVKDEQTKKDLASIIEEVLKQRIQGVKNEKGVYITPAFPKLIYALEEDNITEDSKYWYLTELAAKCTAKRMVPDYVSEKKMFELKEGNCFPPMSCRSFVSPNKDENGKYRFYGKFNKGVVTINLVDVACSSNKDMDLFWKIFDERLELCHRALLIRYEHLKGTKSDVAPILWQYGAYARLNKGEVIDKYLSGENSSISLGYAGIYECVKYMLGISHTEDKGTEFALKVLQYMNDKCDKWNEELNLGFGIYGTPIESTTYKFSKCLKNRFGIIEGVTDKNYITNSYHVHVTEPIDAFTKLTLESKFQSLSKGGSISYVEVPNMENNIPAVLSVIKHIYNTIMYAEINTKSDYCQVCGYNGEIQIIEDEHKKLIWQCPNCKNTDQNKMNVARRTCGYIGTNYWNQGRTQEIKERVTHL